MKIFHVVSSFAVGGAERVASDLAVGQVARGHDVTVIALRRTPAGQEPFAAAMLATLRHGDVSAIDLNAKNFRTSLPWLIFTLRRLIQKKTPDILHLHVDAADFVGGLASLFIDVKVVRTIHNTILWPTHFVMGWIAEHAFSNDSVVSVSNDALFAYEAMRKRFGLLPAQRRKVIFNGIPLLDPQTRAPRNERRKLAYIGRNNPQKGLDILLKALELLTRKDEAMLQMDIYSDIAQQDCVVPRSDHININVFPPTPKAREIMDCYDVLVVPSRFEGLPLVPLEAMASGVPVIVTDVPGLREVTPPAWPLVVPAEDHKALAAMIESVAVGAHDLIELGQEARIFASRFGLDQQIDAYEDVYRNALCHHN